MFAEWPRFHSEPVFLIVKISITFKRTQNGKKKKRRGKNNIKWIDVPGHPCLIMQPMKSLNGYCFSLDIKIMAPQGVLNQQLITGGQKKAENPRPLSHWWWIQWLVGDTDSRYMKKPTALCYYGCNYHGSPPALINLFLKAFFAHLNLHNKHAMNYFFWRLFFFLQSFCFHTKIS